MGLFIFPGDLFRTRCQVLVCPVNCSGTVEKGLMGRLRKRIPAAFQDYQQRCGRHEIKIGCPYLFSASSPQVLFFPIRNGGRSEPKLEWIAAGLEYFQKHHRKWQIDSVAFPVLGHGPLDWRAILNLMEQKLCSLDDVHIEIYVPDKLWDELLEHYQLTET